LAQKLLTE